MFFMINLFSLFFILSSSSWISLWAGMELNLYSFVFILLLYPSSSTTRQSSGTALTYFIVQAIGSLMILLAVVTALSSGTLKLLSASMLLVSLFLKMGAAPLHFWVPWMISNMPWLPLFWLLTIQKLPPLCVLSSLLATAEAPHPSDFTFLMILAFSGASAMAGSFLGLFQTRLSPLLAYSSINQNAWLALAAFLSTPMLVLYFFLYALTLAPICYIMNKNQSNMLLLSPNWNMMPPSSKMLMIINFIVMAGIPPFILFYLKATIFLTLSSSSTALWPFLLLILGSILTTFFYVQFIINMLLPSANHPKLPPFTKNYLLAPLMVITLLMMPTILFLSPL